MNEFLKLADVQRKKVYDSIAHKIGLPAQVVEKDFWVTAILQAVFALPIAENIVFKGGTSLSKVWQQIERFSEDIDLAIDPMLWGITSKGPTKKQIKKLRKDASLFVLEKLPLLICEELEKQGLDSFIKLEPQPNGEGDNTYPEPRQIYIHYESVFDKLAYLRSDIVLEVSARSLLEPTKTMQIKSIVAENLPTITPLKDSKIHTAIPEKTFLEKVFLLHELFSIPEHGLKAERRSRHLYDLYVMMNNDIARDAVANDVLWETICHHRAIYTSVKGVDYTPDVRKRLQLIPKEEIRAVWQADYEAMKESMIYGNKPSFSELLEAMLALQTMFREKRSNS
jgi:hypothetical protein